MPDRKEGERPAWYRLDNAAKLYPAVRTARWSANFRVSATLSEEVDRGVLQEALDAVTARLKNFHMRLHRGFFWYYLEESGRRSIVLPDAANPCTPFRKRKQHGELFRVRCYHRRIAVELFHVLSDGSGAMIFLKTLVAEYLRRKKGLQIPAEFGVIDCSSPPDPEEMEDAFQRYAKFRTLKSRSESAAYHYKSALLPPGEISVITGEMPLGPVLQMAKAHGVTLTEFLVGVMILSLAEIQKQGDARVEKPVKVSVPVNLRKYYPSATLRNFSLYVNPGIEPRFGEFSLQDILEDVHHFMRRNLQEKYLNAVLCKNLSTEQNPALRVVPLFIKNIAMSLGFRLYGDRLVSSTLSNLGEIRIPDAMRPYVECFDFMLGRFLTSIPNATALSYGGKLRVTWTSGMQGRKVEQGFFTTLVKLGIPVKIESNQR